MLNLDNEFHGITIFKKRRGEVQGKMYCQLLIITMLPNECFIMKEDSLKLQSLDFCL